METEFNISKNFVLLGIEEMERFKYLYCSILLITYFYILLFSCTIIFVVVFDESLHEPMYTLIAILLLNGILWSSCVFPKLIIDLLFSSKEISRVSCVVQASTVILFGHTEISTFTIMAYDTYLAVGHPLRYPTLMTNSLALKLIMGSMIFNIVLILPIPILAAKLPICGSHISNVYCDNPSILVLACVDTSLNKLYGNVSFVSYIMAISLILIFHSYLRIYLICLKISKDACKKAIHTLVTHLLNFSIFMIGILFIFARYRLGNTYLPLIYQILLSVISFIFTPLLTPIIYGIRMQTLKMKIIYHLQHTIFAR
ncbi:olfactory receptor 51G2-like [Xenopus laevis]|uniref:Olfactory receptor 51G2-like n=1 Tax=Xenopus laevis TaxID=8355 RepID=A0A8J1M894_XENLA|nr:olfactory receptor 51G2-like [Xenopus laevis]